MPQKEVEAAPSEPSPQTLVATNPDNIRSVYVNNMELSVSSMDARLMFNEIITEQGHMRAERRANLVMPVLHLKAMVEVLNNFFESQKKE
jgi:hypothetical protein